MKKTFIFLLSVICCFGVLNAQDDINVLRYYAVDNSLDGQPAVDLVNILRFYPVFAMQDGIKTVQVTIYYGANRFCRKAEKMKEGKYWQVLLPKFRLGEAIQRLEVEVRFEFKKTNVERFHSSRLVAEQKFVDNKFKTRKKQFALDIDKSDTVYARIVGKEDTSKDYFKAFKKSFKTYISLRDSGLSTLQKRNQLDNWMIERLQLRDEYLNDFHAKEERIGLIKKKLVTEVLNEIEAGLIDTSYAGPSVKKSDFVLVEDKEGRPIAAKILYRNYKQSLRRLQTFDPVEKMGIFRVRYVPFPIVGSEADSKVKLLAPLQETSPTVFEVGLSFGETIVRGDEFVLPSFSIDRLGVAFAITEKMFDDDAEVRALALTYDFNSYGSLGVGANFHGDKTRWYFSFGINKRAFENAIAGLTQLFQ